MTTTPGPGSDRGVEHEGGASSSSQAAAGPGPRGAWDQVRARLGESGPRAQLGRFAQLDHLARLDELGRLAALDRLDELGRLSALDRLERLDELAGLTHLESLGQLERLERMERDLAILRDRVEGHDSRLDMLTGVVASLGSRLRRPPYGLVVPGLGGAALARWRLRCRLIEHHLQPVGDLRVLDLDTSGGYVAGWLAARGATVVGWEQDPAQAEVARLAATVTGLPLTVLTGRIGRARPASEPRHDPAGAPAPTASAAHHAAVDGGVEAGAEGDDGYPMAHLDPVAAVTGQDAPDVVVALDDLDDDTLAAIVERAVVVVERRGVRPPELADAAVETHEVGHLPAPPVGRTAGPPDSAAEPLGSTVWALRRRRRSITVNGATYSYRRRTAEAYPGSPLPAHGAGRRYFFDDRHIVKEYRFDGEHAAVNRAQILAELDVLNRLADVAGVPRLLDYDVVPDRARLVIARVPGQLLADRLPVERAEADRIVTQLLVTLAALEERGLNHNDVRTWNVIDDGTTATLIDYGLASPVPSEHDLHALAAVARAVLDGVREDRTPRPRSDGAPAADATVGAARHAQGEASGAGPADVLFQAVASGETSARALLSALSGSIATTDGADRPTSPKPVS